MNIEGFCCKKGTISSSGFQIHFAFDGMLPVPGFDILIFLDDVCSSMTFQRQWLVTNSGVWSHA